MFVGYTLVLIIDKVMFDTHGFVEGNHGHDDSQVEQAKDPAEKKLLESVRKSVLNTE